MGAFAGRGRAFRVPPSASDTWIPVSGLDFAYPLPNECKTQAPPHDNPRPMALTQSFTRFGLATIERKVGNVSTSANLASLSQRKLNALGLPLAYVDCDRRYRFVNKAFLEWTGKVYHRRHRAADPRRHGPGSVPAVRGLRRGGARRRAHGLRAAAAACPGRPAIWIHVDYYPDRGTDGDVRGFLVCYANVDQLKRLELEAGGREHRLRLVTDSVGSPIIHFDRNLKLRFANKPFGDWIGVAPDDLLGRRMQELIAGGTFADMDEHIDRAFSGAKVSFERRERKSTGELRWVRITLFPDRAVGGRVDGIFAVMTDIDDDVGIRDALRAQEVQLRLFADNIPGPDRLSRSRVHVHLRQPGVRELGAPAAGADLRPHAVRSAGARASPRSCGRCWSARTAASTSSTSASTAAPTASSAGCTAASRRTSTPTASSAASTAPNTTSTT